MEDYNFSEIEAKWQRYWKEKGTFHTNRVDGKPKYYCLVMFPYPWASSMSGTAVTTFSVTRS